MKFKFSRNSLRTTHYKKDDKNIFQWTAKLAESDNLQENYKLIIEGHFHEKVIVSNFKLYMENYYNSANDLEVHQSTESSWFVQVAHNFLFPGGSEAVESEIRLTADLNLHEPLPLLISKSVFSLFENAKYSDLNLIVRDQIFHVHKSILMERSPVFEAMVEQMSHNLNESIKIEITDFEPETVKHFLIFLYLGIIIDPYKIPELYLIADKVSYH